MSRVVPREEPRVITTYFLRASGLIGKEDIMKRHKTSICFGFCEWFHNVGVENDDNADDEKIYPLH